MLSLYQQSLKSKMKCTLIILFTFLALSAALKCQQCTGPGIFSLCNGIDDNGIEVDCDGANDMACYYSTFPIDGKTLNFHYKKGLQFDLKNRSFTILSLLRIHIAIGYE